MGELDTLCQKGVIQDPLECKSAGKSLGIEVNPDPAFTKYAKDLGPGGCYMEGGTVWFNTVFPGKKENWAKPICNRGKYLRFFCCEKLLECKIIFIDLVHINLGSRLSHYKIIF